MRPKWLLRFRVGDKVVWPSTGDIWEVVFTGHVFLILRGPNGEEFAAREDQKWRKVKP